jgi:hypothetical protein
MREQRRKQKHKEVWKGSKKQRKEELKKRGTDKEVPTAEDKPAEYGYCLCLGYELVKR